MLISWSILLVGLKVLIGECPRIADAAIIGSMAQTELSNYFTTPIKVQ
jgi:hypothetical protein